MIEIDQSTFETIVSAAACAGVEVFEAMQDALDEARKRVFYEVADEEVIEAGSDTLKYMVTRWICLDAFYHAIPQLDLVLTPTGFGVVSNQNVAPASRDRVAALQENIRDGRDDALDNIIILLLGNEAWADSMRASLLVPSVIYVAGQLQDFAGMEGHRTELMAMRPKINEAEQRIKDVCSSEQFEKMLDHIRHDSLSTPEWNLVHSMQRAIGYYLNNLWAGFERELQYIGNYLEDNLMEFQDYANSKTYKVKHFENYENQREDSTYFFG
jgi:hypothetical protein